MRKDCVDVGAVVGGAEMASWALKALPVSAGRGQEVSQGLHSSCARNDECTRPRKCLRPREDGGAWGGKPKHALYSLTSSRSCPEPI